MTAHHPDWKPLPDVLKAAVKEFDKWAKADLETADAARKIQAPLYHYTDAASLEGIIKNQEVWFTSHTHLNDPSEIGYGMTVASDLLSEIGKRNEGLVNIFCAMVNDLFTLDNMKKAFGFFIASFSREPNDLGQWRAYGDNGEGFSLGLSPDLFQATEKIRKRAKENVVVIPVVYGANDGRTHHMPPIQKAIEIVEKTALDNYEMFREPSQGMPFFDKLAKSLISSHLILNSLTIKHPAYRHEREVRLVIVGQHKGLRRDLATRTRRGEIVPFIKSKMRVQDKGSIVGILIGPSATDNAEIGLRSLLRSFHDNPDSIIGRSDIPYRVT
jgi:hypothetical protein